MAITPDYVFAALAGLELSLFRIGGPGLGNLLFPWARAKVYAWKTGRPLISPTWPQLKLGPLLRGERDNRLYWNQFMPDDGEVAGSRKLALLAGLNWQDENGELIRRSPMTRKTVRIFRGLGRYFLPIRGYQSQLRDSLERISVSQRANIEVPFPSIGVHVRLGDFAPSRAVFDGTPNPGNTRVPLTWYIDAIRSLLVLRPDITRVLVFSDGSNEELSPLLQLSRTIRVSAGSAIADMLCLSRTQVVLATPGSTFGYWAAFLGNSSTITCPTACGYESGGDAHCETANPSLLDRAVVDALIRSAPR